MRRRCFIVADPDHSLDEDRFILLGVTERDRLAVVTHAVRGDAIRGLDNN